MTHWLQIVQQEHYPEEHDHLASEVHFNKEKLNLVTSLGSYMDSGTKLTHTHTAGVDHLPARPASHDSRHQHPEPFA